MSKISNMTDKQLPSYPLRMPQKLRVQLTSAAKESGRSMNAEIVARLDRSFSADKDVEEVAFEAAFEATGLKQEIERLNALLRANESKASQAPSADEIADKVAARLQKMIPIPLEDLDRLMPDYAKPSLKKTKSSNSS